MFKSLYVLTSRPLACRMHSVSGARLVMHVWVQGA